MIDANIVITKTLHFGGLKSKKKYDLVVQLSFRQEIFIQKMCSNKIVLDFAFTITTQ